MFLEICFDALGRRGGGKGGGGRGEGVFVRRHVAGVLFLWLRTVRGTAGGVAGGRGIPLHRAVAFALPQTGGAEVETRGADCGC